MSIPPLGPNFEQETTAIFNPEGVKIRVLHNKPVVIRRLDPDPIAKEGIESKGGQFVITYEILEIMQDCETRSPSLSYAYELEVRFTDVHLKHLKVNNNYNQLTLWYFKNGNWNQFTHDHRFQIIPDGNPLDLRSFPPVTSGIGRAYFRAGEDPSVGWNL